MTIDLDDRIHTLMNRLSDATPMAPTFESITERDREYVREVMPTRRRMSIIVPVAVVVSVIVPVFVVVAVRRGDGSASSRGGVEQVAADTAGWTAVGAFGPGTRVEEPVPGVSVSLYASDQSPYGPIVAVTGTRQARGTGGGDPTDGTDLTLSNGRRAFLTNGPGERSWLDVEMSPGVWAGLASRHVSDSMLRELATAIELDDLGEAKLSDAAVTKAGLRLAGTRFDLIAPFDVGAKADTGSIPDGMTLTVYRSPKAGDPVTIAIYPINPFDQASLGLRIGPSVGVDGLASGPTGDDGQIALYREREGLAYFVAGPSAHVAVMRELLNSLAPVSERRWQQLVTKAKIDRQQQAPSDATLVSPETTRPPSPVATQRKALATTVETTAEGDYRLTVSTPDGRSQALIVRFRGRSMSVDTLDLPGEQQTTQLDVGSLDGRAMSSTGKDGWTFIVAAESLQHAAPLIGVVVNGTRYVAELQQLDPSYPIKVGVILVNTGAASTGAIPEGEFTDNNDNLVYR